ncbi:methyltransferase [Streptomyces sp. NPDC005438]|uniref:methyltransferase n=1 Tax=Streptomyces sp. NPDC005438 TaxID=3156880 RepID=UPI0033AF4D89
MSEDGERPQPGAGERLVRMIFGTTIAHSVGAAARLRVVDALGDTEREYAEVARELDVDPQGLLRLLRALTGLELLTEPRPGVFAATEFGRLLGTDHPQSLVAFAEVFTDRLMVRSWEDLADCVRTGQPAFPQHFGKSYFDYLEERPELSARFNASMRESTRGTAKVLPDAFDFSTASTLVDVGGGDGSLLAAVLRRYPDLRGTVYDTPGGLAQAASTMAEAQVADRFHAETGDFFTSVPEGADLYLLKSVIHDWSDDQCVTLLGNVREALPEHGRVLILEPVMPPVARPEWAGGYLSDLNMLVNLGGRERTEADYVQLCQRAGLRPPTLTRLPGGNAFSLIETSRA